MVKMKNIMKGESKVDVFIEIIIVLIISVAVISVLYPLYFVVIASISDPVAVQSGEVLFLPKGITFEGYKRIVTDPLIIRGYLNSIFLVLVGTTINVALTIPAGYALSKKNLPLMRFFMLYLVFTMFFNGGLIPTYLLVKNLGLLDTLWALVLTDAVSVFNIILVINFFHATIPNELYEAATIDGASDFKTFTTIALPLAKPIIFIMILFYGVGQWSQFFKGVIYLQSEELYPLQMVLRNILIQNTGSANTMTDSASFLAQQRVAELMKYGTIVVASIPPLIVYPFVRKHLAKGMMVGSVKG